MSTDTYCLSLETVHLERTAMWYQGDMAQGSSIHMETEGSGRYKLRPGTGGQKSSIKHHMEGRRWGLRKVVIYIS